ncbi:MAG TPA: NEW3 domain-containing protein, partial [Candidatus Caenarcaniphilales bacterium]|nr:NEW3 domain-containing protein [Candidatus Caenarcaniphilales bacterium]
MASIFQEGQNVRLIRGVLLSVALIAGSAPASVLAQEGLEVTTAYPAVTVDPGGQASFPLLITTTAPERVDLALTGVPEGWDVRLRGGGSTIEAVYTGGEEPPEAVVEVGVPAEAAAGDYQVVLEARTATLTHQLTLDLTVADVEAGAVALTAEFPSLRGPADAAFRFDLELENRTNQETTFSLETQAPEGWTVEARPTGEEQAATAVVE